MAPSLRDILRSVLRSPRHDVLQIDEDRTGGTASLRAEALDCLDAILATDGLDAVFVGRADLAVAMNEARIDAHAVQAATERSLTPPRAPASRPAS